MKKTYSGQCAFQASKCPIVGANPSLRLAHTALQGQIETALLTNQNWEKLRDGLRPYEKYEYSVLGIEPMQHFTSALMYTLERPLSHDVL